MKDFAREIVDAMATEPPSKPWHDWVALVLVPTAVSTALLVFGLLLGWIETLFNV